MCENLLPTDFQSITTVSQVVGADGHHGDVQEPSCFERENVLAHVPSVKLETISPKVEDPVGGSSDEEGSKPTVSEEQLSR